MTLAVGDLADHIKGVELEPAGKITALWVVDEKPLRLLEEELGGIVDKGLVLNQRGHGKGRVDTAAELLVEFVVRRAEQARESVALDHRLLNDVEVGLSRIVSASSLVTIRGKASTDLDETLIKTVYGL